MSGYSVGNVGYNDYMNLLGNQYLYAYNPNFTANPYLGYYGMNNSSNVSFEGAQKANKSSANISNKGLATAENKSNGVAAVVLSTAITLGAAALCRKAYVRGGGQGWFSKDCLSKIKNGFVGLFNDAKAKFPKLSERFTINADGKICQIPGKMNKLQGVNMADDIVRLGGSADIPKLADDGVEILEATYQINSRSSVVFKDGKISKFINSRGKAVPVGEMTPAEQDKVAKILRKIQNKDTETLDKLSRVSYSKTQNEVTSYFAKGFDAAEDGITDGLQYAHTRKFDFDSDEVKVYLKEHEQLKKSVDDFLKGTNTNLKHAYAEYQIPQGTLRIQDDKVVGIKIGDKLFDTDSTKFKALDLEDTVEHILDNKDKFINQRYKF